MDELTKENALSHMESVGKSLPQSDKFSVKLYESRNDAASVLLGNYGALVKSRGMKFILDASTISKTEKIVKWMYESDKRGLLLCGYLGNGKTTMLQAINLMFGTRSVYLGADDIYNYFKSNQCLPKVADKDLLLVDDLGNEPSRCSIFGDVYNPLAEMLIHRHKENATTIISTNLTFEQIGQRYGNRLKDRMYEMYAILKYLEPSYRPGRK